MNDRDLIFEQYKLIKEEEPTMTVNSTGDREEKPTMTVNSSGNREWKLSNGELHRLDGPAIEGADGHKEWWINDKRHRLDGPAIEWADGTKEWWINDKRHRLDGPAYEGADGHKAWWINDKRHRLDGPAIEWADGTNAWYLNSMYYSDPEEWAKAVLNLHNKPHDKESIEEFLRDIYAKQAEDLL